MSRNPRLARRLLLVVAITFALLILLHRCTSPPPLRKAIVVPRLSTEDTSWLRARLPDWEHAHYTVDEPAAALTVVVNKCREVMTYLTYIIDRYEKLPDVTVFVHAGRYAWHNDHPIYDMLPLLTRLRVEKVLREGYVNLRCTHRVGCPIAMKIPPAELTPDISTLANATKLGDLHPERFYAKAFRELFPGKEVPREVGASCCAQFAVTKKKAQEVPLAEWKRWRRWVMQTELPDGVCGRVWEYSWHMVFGKPAVHCPDAAMCYCETWGKCGLECQGRDCGWYELPPKGTLPLGWPEVGWDGGKGPEEGDFFR